MKFFRAHYYIIALACVVAGLLAVACNKGGGGGGAGGGTGGGGSQNFKLAFVTNNASDFWTIARKGVEQADNELANVTVEFKIPADGTAAEQRRIIDDLLAKGVAGIAMSPVDPDNETQLINDTAKQALVVTQDSDAPASDRACYIGTDNRAAGKQAGELIKEVLPQGGKILEHGRDSGWMPESSARMAGGISSFLPLVTRGRREKSTYSLVGLSGQARSACRYPRLYSLARCPEIVSVPPPLPEAF
jgi:ABC-type sugar transport system substrate-binding protein